MPKGRRKTLKGRAAWRKIDISDIRDGAMKKTDDMLAGRAGDANSTESLFTIEKAKPKRPTLPLDPEARKARARAKVTHVDKMLLPNPYSKAEKSGPVVKVEEKRSKKRQFNNMVQEVLSGERQLKAPLDMRSEVAGKMRSRSLKDDAEETTVKTTSNGVFDLWDERASEVASYKGHHSEFGFDDDWWQPSRKKPKMYDESRAGVTKKRSGREAVEIAGPGASYNPDYESHQEALREALEFYTHKADRSKQLAKRMPSFKPQPEPLVFAESDKESDDDSTEESQNKMEEDTVAPVNMAHIPRKTKEDRKKAERQRRHQAMLAAIAQRKHENREFHKLKSVINDTDDSERIKLAKREAREALEEQRAPTKIVKMGAVHYTHKAPEVALTEDLSGTMRGIKPHSSVMEDRFASLQRRNLIEVRHKAKRNSHVAKTKQFTKAAFKDAPLL